MWHFITLAIIVSYLLFYCILPNVWFRNYSKIVVRHGKNDAFNAYLTFDDGPNPEYTPQILETLNEYGVKATFFVVGRNAYLYPKIIREILSNGHSIGIHSYSHIHAWLMLPNFVFKDLAKSCCILKELIDKQPIWYRPPWGIFNLASPLAAKQNGLTAVYWSVSANDWKLDITPEQIANTVIAKTKPGAIIVLHDNGGKLSTPKKTIEALPLIIGFLKQQGYRFVTLNESGGDFFVKKFD